MIKLIIFDLDGVLVESSKKMHFEVLNKALGDKAISWDDHLKKYDGLPTTKKLELMGISGEEKEDIWRKKQNYTLEYVSTNVKTAQNCVEMMVGLKAAGLAIAVASNTIRLVTKLYLIRLGLIEFIDLYLSNQDVKCPKPNPEIYLKCMIKFSVSPEETLIIEDSPYGLTAAYRSGANVVRVSGPEEVTHYKIMESLSIKTNVKEDKWVDKNLNVLIPMAGLGSRFEKAGYSFPKPLISIDGKPMIQWVVDSLKIEANYIYIVRKEHRDKYALDYLLNFITPGCTIIDVEETTEGAACTTLLAETNINNNKPLLIANSDQFIEWNAAQTMYFIQSIEHIKAAILTFRSTHPQWSYVKTDEYDMITEVREKQVISDRATVGIYYVKQGKDYVSAVEKMIEKDLRYNNEFYVAPAFNEMIEEGKIIKAFDVKKMWGLGTPELLEEFKKGYL